MPKQKRPQKFNPKSSKLGSGHALVGAFIFGAIAALMIIVANAAPPGGFETLPPGAALPSESNCASRVRAAAEIRSTNASYNQTRGIGGNYQNSRITGNYTGTTDQIIQWAACKWGMDEDILRAQMAKESYWTMNAYGDWSNDSANCPTILPVRTYSATELGGTARTGCPESLGISQVRWNYHKSAFYSSATENASTLTNNAIYSTAYNLDYYASIWRSCYNGELGWLNTVERGAEYAAGDVWGCLGVWFSGRWRTQPALTYIADVQNYLNDRIWEQSYFRNFTTTAMILTRSGGSTPPPSGGGGSTPPPSSGGSGGTSSQPPAGNSSQPPAQTPTANDGETAQPGGEEVDDTPEEAVVPKEDKAISKVPVVGTVYDSVTDEKGSIKPVVAIAFSLPVLALGGFLGWKFWWLKR